MLDRRLSKLAARLAMLAMLAVTPAALAQDVEITERARAHFKAGVALLQDPDGARYEDAYREFKAAYAESASWKILGNLGLAAMKLERDGEAIEAYEKYLAQGGSQIDPDERAQVERDLATLKAGAVTLTLSSTPAGAALTDERSPVTGAAVVNQYGPLGAPLTIRVRPGHHRLTARLAGHRDAVWELEARSGGTESHAFQLEPAAVAAAPLATPGSVAPGATAMERPVPVGVFIGAVATGVFAVGAGVTGVMALGKQSEFDDAISDGDPSAANDARDSGQTLNLVTDVLIGAAVVSGAVTAVLFFTRPEVPAQRDHGLALTPALGPAAATLALSGRF